MADNIVMDADSRYAFLHGPLQDTPKRVVRICVPGDTQQRGMVYVMSYLSPVVKFTVPSGMKKEWRAQITEPIPVSAKPPNFTQPDSAALWLLHEASWNKHSCE
jgi:hypothetical protein